MGTIFHIHEMLKYFCHFMWQIKSSIAVTVGWSLSSPIGQETSLEFLDSNQSSFESGNFFYIGSVSVGKKYTDTWKYLCSL